MTVTTLRNTKITTPPIAYFDIATSALVITDQVITDHAVVAEALHWSTGQRGVTCEASALAAVDLSPFVRRALNIGVQVIALAGDAQDTFELKQLIEEVGLRTSRATDEAAQATADVLDESTRAMKSAAAEASKVFAEAGKAARGEFADTVRSAKVGLNDELRRLFGGDDPELARRLDQALSTFGNRVDAVSAEKTEALVAKTALQFTDEFAKLTTVLERFDAGNHARGEVERKTPLKGATYENKVNEVMHTIAAGLGNVYQATGTQPGVKSSSKKGDGVLSVPDSEAVVVFEMSDSERKNWPEYLAAAEATRCAQASLGLVPNASMLHGSSILLLGPRRIVMVFDPDTDDPELLRTVVQLLRLGAIAAAARVGATGAHTADEKLEEALTAIEKFAKIQKCAHLIHQHADTVSVEAGSLQDLLQALLTQARTALAVADSEQLSANA